MACCPPPRTPGSRTPNKAMPAKIELERIVLLAYEREKHRVLEETAKGLSQIRAASALFGFTPSRWFLDFGATCAFLYARSGKIQFAHQARDALLYYRDWLDELS